MHYIFIIDTDAYAGNFEREMTAYMTGEVGECCVGATEAEMFCEEMCQDDTCVFVELFEEKIMQKPDEYGCHRPCALGYDLNGEANSVEIYFYDMPTQKMIKILKDRAYKFVNYIQNKKEDDMKHNYPSKICGFRIQSEETIVKDVKDWEE